MTHSASTELSCVSAVTVSFALALVLTGCDNAKDGQPAASPLAGLHRPAFSCLGASTALANTLGDYYERIAGLREDDPLKVTVRHIALSNTVNVDSDLNTLICDTRATYDVDITQPAYYEQVAGKENGHIGGKSAELPTLPSALAETLRDCQSSVPDFAECSLDVTKTYFQRFRLVGGPQHTGFRYSVVRSEQGDITVPEIDPRPPFGLKRQMALRPSRVEVQCRLFRPTADPYVKHGEQIACSTDAPASNGWHTGWTPDH